MNEKASKASRVLIVDDMSVNRMILSSLLASNGVASDQAESGEECLALCSEKDYDLILLDHRMPSPDGVDTLVMLKALFEKQGRQVPVICHTTAAARDNINLYKAAGFADVLIKPVDLMMISSLLMTYLPEEDRLSRQEEERLVMPEEEGAPSVPVEEEEGEERDELDKLPLWLKRVPHIDLTAGLENCETAEDYLDALYIFHLSIEEKASAIRWSLESRDYTTYALLVHSLKSTAALIGAGKLSACARDLEAAAKAKDRGKLTGDTPALLDAYTEFTATLSPISEESQPEKKPAIEDRPPSAEEDKKSSTVLFIQEKQGIIPAGIENILQKAGFHTLSIPDEPHLIISNRFNADLVLYMPGEKETSHTILTMNLLGEICHDDSKILCLTGEQWDLERAMTAGWAFRVTRVYPRPLQTEEFIRDMKVYAALEKDYHRMKTLFFVDDDPDYLDIIHRWFSQEYALSCFPDSQGLLDGLKAAIPDLILMDYEMPGMDGYELMKTLRQEEGTKNIPVIFLTVKNDRDHVSRILEYKPDGYLLKTSQKEALLDAIRRFFSGSLFKKSLLAGKENEDDSSD